MKVKHTAIPIVQRAAVPSKYRTDVRVNRTWQLSLDGYPGPPELVSAWWVFSPHAG